MTKKSSRASDASPCFMRTVAERPRTEGAIAGLVALPGVRALEVTSQRLESIMKYSQTDYRRASSTSRVVFVAGMALLVPGTGITFQSRLQANEGAEGSPPAVDANAEPDLGKVQGLLLVQDENIQQRYEGTWKIVHCEFSGRATLKSWARTRRSSAANGSGRTGVQPNTGSVSTRAKIRCGSICRPIDWAIEP